ncbi:MAG: Tex family protein [bacterium]|nr:Tex family protein [bacterium]
MDIIGHIADQLGLKLQQVQQALALLAEGNTVPFITRYRKEATGGLDEEELRRIQELEASLRGLDDRRQVILRSIAEQGLLDDQLRAALEACTRLVELEDLYLPFRPRRKTRASEARRRGLAPLAGLMLADATGLDGWLEAFCRTPGADEEVAGRTLGLEEARLLRQAGRDAQVAAFCGGPEVPGAAEALAGARDILAEWLTEQAPLRTDLRHAGARHAVLRSRLRDESHPEAPKFRLYAAFAELLRDLPPHRVLALNRGEKLGALQLTLDWTAASPLDRIAARLLKKPASAWRQEVLGALADGLERLLLPSLTRELREEKTREAEGHSLDLYAANLRQLLLQPPLTGRRVMGIDPGYRSGCKVAVVDATGALLAGEVIHPHAPLLKQTEARATLLELARRHGVEVVAIGNGTASRETEELVAEWIAENRLSIRYAVVSEAGASVYSASPEARDEFPGLEAAQRGNISIARRLQDPLAELVKIDPRSLGVGQYQHDVDPRRLGERLDAVVESCVNAVGVDLNTASGSLLRHVSGLNSRTSRAVVAWRTAHGSFRRREQLREVAGIGPAAFRQCAGFLRIRDGLDPLDNTGVHPESYEAVRRLFARQQVPLEDPAALAASVEAEFGDSEGLQRLAGELELGLPTLVDILAELRKPGRDPRQDLDPPLLRGGILRLEDLKAGMVVEGTVRNLVDFGAFVDVGVKTEGLIHVSQLSHTRVRHPMDLLKVGQRVRAAVLEVDLARGRLALSLKALEENPRATRGSQRERPGAASQPRREGKPAPGSLAEHWHPARRGKP